MIYTDQIADSLQFCGISFQMFLFVRERLTESFDKLRVSHRIVIRFAFIVDGIESGIIQPSYFQLVHDAEITEILVHHLSFIQTADVVNACIKQIFFPLVRLEASAELCILFYHAYVESFFAENCTAFQSAKATSDDDNIIFAHASPVF